MAAAEVCSYLKLRQEHLVHGSCWNLFIFETKTGIPCAWQLLVCLYTKGTSHFLRACPSVKLNSFLLCNNECFPFPTSPTDVNFEVRPSFEAIYFPSTNPSTHCANPWDLFCQQVDRQVNMSVWVCNHIACYYIRFCSATFTFAKTDTD
jgi:hypothetical protein